MGKKRTPTADNALERMDAEQGKQPAPPAVIKPTSMTRKETKYLSCKLTAEEILAKAHDLAQKHEDCVRLDGELKKAKGEITGKIEEAKTHIGTLSGCIQSGSEYRDVACVETKDWKAGLVTVIRTDTGEEITRRPMREDEKQMEIPGVVPDADESEDAADNRSNAEEQ